jgi:hypothetical protein
MKRIILIVLIVFSLSPGTSHAFGLLQYTMEAVANQLGLDRGPIPKIAPQWAADPCDPRLDPHKRIVYYPDPQLQAEGF